MDNDPADTEENVTSRKPSSLAELQILYNEAVRDARKAQKNLLQQIERNQEDERTRLNGDSFCKFRDWVQDLDPVAPGIQEELKEVQTQLKKLGIDDLAFDVQLLEAPCFRIETYRLLMNQSNEEK